MDSSRYFLKILYDISHNIPEEIHGIKNPFSKSKRDFKL